MDTLATIIQKIQTHALSVTGVVEAPNTPPESINQFPFAVAYPGNTPGTVELQDGSTYQYISPIFVEFHVSRQNLPTAVTEALTLQDEFFRALSADPTLSGSVDTIIFPLQFQFGRLEWNGVETLGWRFTIDVKARYPVYGGFDWYVDSKAGSDTNNGTSSLTPFKTLTKLMTAWSAGDSVGLARGSHFREKLVLAGHGHTIRAYGTGAKPIIDGSDRYTASDVSVESLRYYIRNISTTDWYGSSNDYVQFWINDKALEKTTDALSSPARRGQWRIDAGTEGVSSTIDIEFSDFGADPNATPYPHSSDYFDIAVRPLCIDGVNKNNLTLENIVLQRTGSFIGTIRIGANFTATGCEFREGSWNLVYINDGGTVLTDCYIGKKYRDTFLGVGTALLYWSGFPTTQNATLTNCVIEQANPAEQPAAGSAAYEVVGINWTGNIGSFLATNTQIQYCHWGMKPGDSTSIVWNGGTFTDVAYNITHSSAPPDVVHEYNDVVFRGKIKRLADWSTCPGNTYTPITLNRCRITLIGFSSILFYQPNTGQMNAMVNDCVFELEPDSIGTNYIYYSPSTFAFPQFQRNYYNYKWNYIIYANSTFIGNSNYNTYEDPDTVQMRAGGVTYVGIPAWYAGTGQDATYYKGVNVPWAR